MNFYYGLFASSILLILYIFLSVRKINLIIVTLNILKRAELLGFILILMIFILAAALLGSYHAKKLGEGTLSDVIGIEFKTKRTFTEIDNKKLILILHNEGKYFVVEKQNPLPEYPNVFILPDEQVEFAIMKRIN